jgi:hypothetical protein
LNLLAFSTQNLKSRHTLGKAEVDSSILSGGTSFFPSALFGGVIGFSRPSSWRRCFLFLFGLQASRRVPAEPRYL